MNKPKPKEADEEDLTAAVSNHNALAAESFASAQKQKDLCNMRGYAQHYRIGQMHQDKAAKARSRLDMIRQYPK